jgi:hypothetical protein
MRLREFGWFGVLADEPFGVAGVGGGQDVGADGLDSVGMSIVDVVWGARRRRNGGVRCCTNGRSVGSKVRASSMPPKVAGKSGLGVNRQGRLTRRTLTPATDGNEVANGTRARTAA